MSSYHVETGEKLPITAKPGRRFPKELCLLAVSLHLQLRAAETRVCRWGGLGAKSELRGMKRVVELTPLSELYTHFELKLEVSIL